MNTDWISHSPQRLELVNKLKIPDLITNDQIPLICLDHSMSNKFAGLYHTDVHRITIQPFIIDTSNDERFINLLLHELGHSTSKKTNRIERLWENCDRSNIEEAYKLEEQIAETIALMFELVIFNNNTTVNIKAFAKYMIQNSSVYDLPWGEIESVIQNSIKKEKVASAAYWSEKIKNYLTRNNLVRIKQGVFNGF
jgi:predicted metalloprotease with PDZ domain